MAVNARSVGVWISLAWMLAVALLSSRNETWATVWRLHCYVTGGTDCGATVYIIVNWPVIVFLMLAPVILGWLVAWVIAIVRRRLAR